jgi:hypothetical protein
LTPRDVTVSIVLLTGAIRVSDVDRELPAAVLRWPPRWQCTIPATVITDLAVMVVWGKDCFADIALLRAQLGVFVQLASDPRCVPHDRCVSRCRWS